MANVLSRDKQEAVISCLVEGSSIRSTERITGVHRDTIMRLGVRVGEGCAKMMQQEMTDLTCKRIQVDEIWGYVGKKQRHVTEEDDTNRVGNVWTFVALDADTKLVPTFAVGRRDLSTATEFMHDLRSRVLGRVQISTDGLAAYIEAIEEAFGANVDYGQVVKSYETDEAGAGRYSPPKVAKVKKCVVQGQPDVKHISTSYVERQNLTMRMQMRRLTRLTNAFSKKPENFRSAVALHFAHYNFVRVHQSLRATPAMEAGVTGHLWKVGDLLDCVE